MYACCPLSFFPAFNYHVFNSSLDYLLLKDRPKTLFSQNKSLRVPVLVKQRMSSLFLIS